MRYLFTGTRYEHTYAITISLNSHHYGTPRAYTIGRNDGSAVCNPMRQYINVWYRNINLFPCRCIQIMIQLRTD